MSIKRRAALTLAGAASAAVMVIAPGTAGAANNQAGNSLVNVQIGDVLVQVPVAVAANLCDINVNVLAQQAAAGAPTCTADADATADGPPGPGASSNRAGDSLVNVQLGDITAQLPIGVAANICDVNANVLAAQAKLGEAACTATATPTT